MTKLTYHITAYQCRIELTKKQFDKLESIDYLDVVMPKLEKLGASEIEYNGHFGEAIFFITDTLEEAQKVTEEIEKMLK
jgi:RNA binding exosome subunit